MAGLLVRDWLRRARAQYLLVGAVVALFWSVSALGAASRPMLLAITMMLAGGFGPMTVLAGTYGMFSREVLLLPVSQRDRWTAAWLVATVLAAAWAVTAQTVGLLLGSLQWGGPVAPSIVPITALLVLAQAGVTLALMDLAGRAARRVTHPVLMTLAMLIVFLAGPFLGFALLPWLPTSFATLTPLSSLCIATGLALVVTEGRRVSTVQAGRSLDQVTVQFGRRRAGRLELPLDGLPRLLCLTSLRALAATGVMLTIFAGIEWFAGSDPGWLTGSTILPFADQTRPPFMAFWLCVSALTQSYGPLVSRGIDPVRATLGQLRVLPVSTLGIVRVLLIGRVLNWGLVWLLLLAGQVLLVGPPAHLGLGWLALMIGVDALGFTTALRWLKHSARQFFLSAAAFLLVALMLLPVLESAAAGAVLVSAGLLTLLVGAAALERTLRSRTAVYRTSR